MPHLSYSERGQLLCAGLTWLGLRFMSFCTYRRILPHAIIVSSLSIAGVYTSRAMHRFVPRPCARAWSL